MVDDFKEKLGKLLETMRSRKANSVRPIVKIDPPSERPGLDRMRADASRVPSSPITKQVGPNHAKGSTENVSTKPTRSSLEITLGLDFGTRFTKVAAFLRQTGQYKVLPVGPNDSPFLKSRVVADAAGVLYPPDLPPQTARATIEYLKMHLAGPKSVTFGGNVSLNGHPLQEMIEPLCALYLSGVLRRAMQRARLAFSASSDTHVEWFANVGVPVQYCDGEEIARFRRVAAVAWFWKDASPTAMEADALLRRYRRAEASASDYTDIPIQVVPELAAALAHFVERRTTAEGMYAFFDIGGGTLDGTAFRLIRTNQGNRVNILSAAVDDVGTMAVARAAVGQFYLSMDKLIEKPLIFGAANPTVELPVGEPGYRIQKLFNRVIREAKAKAPTIDFSEVDSLRLPTLAGPGKYLRYPVFLAGGGARSEWYAELFRQTRNEFSHHQVGIGECDVKLLPAPTGFSGDDYPRFVVAIGLTTDSIHSELYRLPSSCSPPADLPPQQPRLESPVSKDYV